MIVINVAADGTITIDQERSQIAVVSVEGGTSVSVEDGHILVSTEPTVIYVNTSGPPDTGTVQSNTALLISGASMDILNRYVDVSFDPNVYHSSGGGLLASDLQIIFTQNGGTATACSISSINNTSGGALVGGEQTVRVNLSFTGSASGVETIEIKPSASGSYKDNDGNLVSPNDTTGAVTVPLEYDPLYKAGLITALTNSYTIPILSQRLVDNAMFVYYRTQGILTELDFLYLFTCNDSMSRINFINGTVQGAFTGTVTITQFSGGLASSGGRFSTGWDGIANAVKFLQNDASVWLGIGNDGQNNALMCGTRGSGSGANFGHIRIQGRTTGDLSGGALNIDSSGNTAVPTITNAEGLHGVSREASNLTRYYHNGSQVATGATASSTLSNQDLYVFSENQNGTASSSNVTLEAMCVFGGSGMQDKITEINTGFQTWKTDTNALIPSIVADKFYEGGGQSNLNGGSVLLSSLTAPQAALYNNGPISIANGYAANVYVKTDAGTPWALLEAGVNGVTGAGGNLEFSPIYPLAVMEANKHPGEDLYFLWRPVAGRYLKNPTGAFDWEDGGVPSSAWKLFKAAYDEGVAELSSITTRKKTIFFQGEAEASNQDDGTLASEYQTRQATVLGQFTSQAGAPGFIVPRIHNSLNATSYPYKSTVRTAQDNNASIVPYTKIDVDALAFTSPHIQPASAIIDLAQLISTALG